MTDRHQDLVLIEACAQDDSQAQRALIDRIMPVLKTEIRWVLRRTPSARGRDRRQELHDLLQDLLVELLANGAFELQRWRPDRGMSLDGFVRLIARRSVVRRLRRADARDDRIAEASIPWLRSGRAQAIASEVEARDELDAILEGLESSMGERDQELFERLFLEQQTSAEAAAAMGMSRDALKKWRSRLYAKVRKIAKRLGRSENPSPFVAAATREKSGGDDRVGRSS